MADDLIRLFDLRDPAEMRLTQAHDDHQLGYALVMAALSWDQVDRRRWRTPGTLGAQAQRLMAAGRVPVESLDDADQVASALEWATQDPALLECDSQGNYRPVCELGFPVGVRCWRDQHREAVASGVVLTPLELIEKGNAHHHANPADLTAAEVSYQLAVDSDDRDAAALASLRLAELAESRDQPAEAARRYADVAALQHPIASPPATLWLARRAHEDGDRPAARVLAHEVVNSGDEALVPEAWGLLATLAWLDKDKEGAVAAIRRAIDTAGQWHWSYSRFLGEILAADGDMSGAADAYRTLLDQPLFQGTDVGKYTQFMTAAGRIDEAIAVLEQYIAQGGFFSGDMLLSLASAHAARDDYDAARRVIARVRAHWSARMPEIAVRTDVMEASVAAADGDDELAARLFRSLTDTDDTERRDLARPLLIASGKYFATHGKLCLIPGVRPLLEYLSEAAPPDTATWAATSLAHLATEEGRLDDAEAAVCLAARHLNPDDVTVLRAMLLRRAGRDGEALDYLINACPAASPSTLNVLLVTISTLGVWGVWPDTAQRLRLRAAVEHRLSAEVDTDVRVRVAIAMGQVELYSCGNPARAIELWGIATESDDPTLAAPAWLNLALMRQWSAPIAAAHAFEQAMLLGDDSTGTHAATELARLAERLGDNSVLARACERVLDLGSGDAWAQAALRLGRINQHDHPDDAEAAYHAAIAEPGAHPSTIGAALARLGALYAQHGNRRLAQRIWRRGKHHRDPHIAEGFAKERAIIGRVTRIRRTAISY